MMEPSDAANRGGGRLLVERGAAIHKGTHSLTPIRALFKGVGTDGAPPVENTQGDNKYFKVSVIGPLYDHNAGSP